MAGRSKHCYSCNGANTVCRRCICARNNKPCHSCLPLTSQKCLNRMVTTTQRPVTTVPSSSHPPSPTPSAPRDCSLSLFSSFSADSPTLGSPMVSQGANIAFPWVFPGEDQSGHCLEDEIKELMIKAYGRPFNNNLEICPWVSRWEIITQHQARH